MHQRDVHEQLSGKLDWYKYGLSRDATRIIIEQGFYHYQSRGYETPDDCCPYRDEVRAYYWWEGFYHAEKKLSLKSIFERYGV